MYDKISAIMNSDFGCSDMDSDLVENYLRKGETNLISAHEAVLIEVLLDRYI